MCCHAGQIFRLLGTAVPSSSNFFLNYVLTKVSEQACPLHKQFVQARNKPKCAWIIECFALPRGCFWERRLPFLPCAGVFQCTSVVPELL